MILIYDRKSIYVSKEQNPKTKERTQNIENKIGKNIKQRKVICVHLNI